MVKQKLNTTQSNEKKFEINHLVWAKMRTFPYWPARIAVPPSCIKKIPVGKECVFFFGTDNFGFVEPQNVVDYNEYRGKFNKMAKSRMFRTAVYCIEEHLRKPNTSLPRTSSGRTLRVKHEDYEYDINTTTNEISSSSSSQDQCTMCAQLLIELQQSRTAYNEIYSQNQKDTDNADIKQRELSKNVKELQTSCSRFDQQNVQLNAKVESLVAQTRQLESKCSQLNKENLGLRDELAEFKSTKLDKHYEVQKLLDDKMDKGEQHFLVEWKGYGAKTIGIKLSATFVPIYEKKINVRSNSFIIF